MNLPAATPPDLPFARRVAPLFATIFVTVAVLFVATLGLPHNPYIRFQQLTKTIQFRSQWVYERIAFDPAPIDVAIVGNSRLGAGVSAPQVQAALRRFTGRSIGVANLTMPQEGRNIHYTIVKQLLERRPEVKLIVLSVIEQMPREGHPAFRDLADAGDVIDAPALLSLDYVNDVSVLPFRQISLFVQSLWPSLFGDVTRFDRARYPGTDYDSSLSFRLPDGRWIDRDTVHIEPELARTAMERVRKITRPLLPAGQANYEFAIERRYTLRIADMAKARGVSVMFLYLPIYKDREPVMGQTFYDRIGPTIRPDFLDSNYRLYSDYGHLNVHGSRLVAPWLAGQIVSLARAGRIRSLSAR